jgi:hypothetical protein
MTRGDVPEWAIERACELASAWSYSTVLCLPTDTSVYLHAFARYIAQHEEPPEDPLLTEAKQIVCAHYSAGFQVDAINAGSWCELEVKFALAGLKRGMELAKERQP